MMIFVIILCILMYVGMAQILALYHKGIFKYVLKREDMCRIAMILSWFWPILAVIQLPYFALIMMNKNLRETLTKELNK